MKFTNFILVQDLLYLALVTSVYKENTEIKAQYTKKKENRNNQ